MKPEQHILHVGDAARTAYFAHFLSSFHEKNDTRHNLAVTKTCRTFT